jgi:RNA polymerase sigma factor (TIGR02999 family)
METGIPKPENASPEDPRQAASDLLPMVYEELRKLARRRLDDERSGHTLQATALVHEAYLRLADSEGFANRAHFFKAAADVMRHILIEHARRRGRAKRGGQAKRLPLNVLDLAKMPDSDEILALDEAIERLNEQAPLAASIVRLRFYAGLTIDETAETLEISARTVDREWTFARAWLFQMLEER